MNTIQFIQNLNPIDYLIGAISIFLLAIAMLAYIFNKLEAKEQINYPMGKHTLSSSIMTKDEVEFYHSLINAAGGDYAVMSNIKLADIINVKKSLFNVISHVERINSKHVDYLLCDKKDLKPVLAVELDKKRHQREDSIAHDTFVDDIFNSIGLPILHYPVKLDYSDSDLRMKIFDAINTKL